MIMKTMKKNSDTPATSQEDLEETTVTVTDEEADEESDKYLREFLPNYKSALDATLTEIKNGGPTNGN